MLAAGCANLKIPNQRSRQSLKSPSPLYNIGLEVSSTCCETTIRRIGLCSRPSCCQSPKFFSLQPYQRRFSCCACPPQRGIKTDLDGHRVAEVVRRHEGSSPKSLDSDEKFKPQHTLFCRKLRFVAIYALFGDLWAKKSAFLGQNSVSWARSALLHGIYCIFDWVKFENLRLRVKTTHLSRKL